MTAFEVTVDPHDEPGYRPALNKYEKYWLMNQDPRTMLPHGVGF